MCEEDLFEELAGLLADENTRLAAAAELAKLGVFPVTDSKAISVAMDEGRRKGVLDERRRDAAVARLCIDGGCMQLCSEILDDEAVTTDAALWGAAAASARHQKGVWPLKR